MNWKNLIIICQMELLEILKGLQKVTDPNEIKIYPIKYLFWKKRSLILPFAKDHVLEIRKILSDLI